MVCSVDVGAGFLGHIDIGRMAATALAVTVRPDVTNIINWMGFITDCGCVLSDMHHPTEY